MGSTKSDEFVHLAYEPVYYRSKVRYFVDNDEQRQLARERARRQVAEMLYEHIAPLTPDDPGDYYVVKVTEDDVPIFNRDGLFPKGEVHIQVEVVRAKRQFYDILEAPVSPTYQWYTLCRSNLLDRLLNLFKR